MRRARDILWGPRAWLPFLGAVAVLRAPAFAVGLMNLDECDFWLFGRMVRDGALPYRGVADNKPPLTYAAFWLADALCLHHRDLAVPLLGVAAVVASALLLRAAARRWTGDPRAGWAAAWLALLAGLCELPTVSAELLMNVPAAAALWALARAEASGRRRFDLAAGLLAGLATLFKPQAGILLLAFWAAALWPSRSAPPPGRRAPRLGRALALGAGFAAPWAAAAGLLGALGVLPEAYDWVVRRNLFQIRTAHVFAPAQVLPGIVGALGAAALAWWLALGQLSSGRRPGDGFQRALAILLFATVIPVSVGQRFYQHYFLQFVPPLALLGAPRLVELAERWAGLGRARRAALVGLPLAALAVNLSITVARAALRDYPTQRPQVQAIAAWLEANTAPDERLFMWGDYAAVYCAADRLPGTRYLRTAPQVGDFDPMHLPAGFDPRPFVSERDVAATLEDLAARRPALVLDTAPADLHRWSLFPLEVVPALRAQVLLRYRPIGAPAGAVVYRRRDLPDPVAPAPAGARR